MCCDLVLDRSRVPVDVLMEFEFNVELETYELLSEVLKLVLFELLVLVFLLSVVFLVVVPVDEVLLRTAMLALILLVC